MVTSLLRSYKPSTAPNPTQWPHFTSSCPVKRVLQYKSQCLAFTNVVPLVTELKDTVAASSSSLNSENPYATIKDLPGPPFCSHESSYMEMKSAMPRERSYTEISPPPFHTATLRRGEEGSSCFGSF